MYELPISCAAFSTSNTLSSGNIDAGLGLRLKEIDRNHDAVLEEGRLLLYLAELFYAFTLAFSKFSILGFYWRLFKTSPIRKPIIILAICSV
jgi:hypothetical protein